METRLISGSDDGVRLLARGGERVAGEPASAARAVQELDARFRAWSNVSGNLFWTLDPAMRFRFAHPSIRRAYGLPHDEMVAQDIAALIHPDDRAVTWTHFEQAIITGSAIDVIFRQANRDGEFCWVRARAERRFGPRALLRKGLGPADRNPLWYGVTEDIHARHVAEAALQASEERLALALGGTGVGVWDWSVATGRTWLSDGALIIQGYKPGESGQDFADCDRFVHPDDRPSHLRTMNDCLSGRVRVAEHEHRLRMPDGGWVWVRESAIVAERDTEGRAIRVIGTRLDIQARKHAESRQRWLAEHDQMTGLLNRQAFTARLNAAVAAAQTRGPGLTILLLDMDDLKFVNDSGGHSAGDMLLTGVADRLRTAVATDAYVGRLGGDEFAILCPGMESEERVCTLVEAIYQGTRPLTGLSIGAAICPAHGETSDTLLQNADVALYRAKVEARGGMVVYRPEMRLPMDERAGALAQANAALASGLLRLSYEPRRSLSTGALAGVQVRIRVDGSDGSEISPWWLHWARQDADVADRLGHFVVERLTADLGHLFPKLRGHTRFAITASSAAIRRAGAAERWLTKLAALGMPVRDLDIQVAEDLLSGRGGEYGLNAVRVLKDAGAHIVLDHFGSGLASLTQLRQVPVAALRIDRRFIDALDDDSDDALIARALVGLGRDLRLTTIAEGVSTRSQLEILRQLGCDIVQGPLIAAPAAADRLETIIAAMLAMPLFA